MACEYGFNSQLIEQYKRYRWFGHVEIMYKNWNAKQTSEARIGKEEIKEIDIGFSKILKEVRRLKTKAILNQYIYMVKEKTVSQNWKAWRGREKDVDIN